MRLKCVRRYHGPNGGFGALMIRPSGKRIEGSFDEFINKKQEFPLTLESVVVELFMTKVPSCGQRLTTLAGRISGQS
jgi:hypothetical protein